MTEKGIKTKQLILNSIIEHVHLCGVNETSMGDIIAISGVKKGNLYFYFKNKEELILETLKEAHRRYQEYLSQNTAHVSDPLEKIEAMINAVVDYHTRRKFKGGCIFGNTALEMADKSSKYRAFIHDVFSQWIAWIRTHLETAITMGLMEHSTPVQELSVHIIAALEGGIMLSKVTKNADALNAAVRGIHELLRHYEIVNVNNGDRHAHKAENKRKSI